MRQKTCILATLALTLLSAAFSACAPEEKKYRIGISQCSADIWRDKQNAELRLEDFFHRNVELVFTSAYDIDQRQIDQIDSLLAVGIDLLIVAPNQVATISPAIDRAFDKGIPVIVFERKTNSKKYTAYMGADNYEMGRIMGEYIAGRMNGRGRVVEIMGLNGSSPAIERHKGFTEVLAEHPGITLVATLQGDWSRSSAYRAVNECDTPLVDIDYVFAQNDRMAVGARQAMAEKGLSPRARYCGIDGLPGPNGGIALVMDSVLDASYIYPTHGDQLLQLAINILEGKPYATETRLKAALVTGDNARVLHMQSEEITRQAQYLERLHDNADNMLAELDYQRLLLLLTWGIFVLLLTTLAAITLYYRQKGRLDRERQRLARQELDFYTQVSHELRTPLTLIEGPLAQLADTPAMTRADESTTNLLDIVRRNARHLTRLVNKMLDAQTGTPAADATGEQIDALTVARAPVADNGTAATTAADDEAAIILVVDDNADIRAYLRNILQGHYRLLEAADGQQGLVTAHEQVPDLIVSDMMMPVMNGLDFCQHVKRDAVTSHIPVILLTARAMSEHQIEGYESGADAYLTKPFAPDLLLARIGNLLQSRHHLKNLWSLPAQPATGQQPDAATGDGDAVHDDAPTLTAPEQAFVDRFKQAVEHRLADSGLSIEQLAADMNLSRVQLYRKVKALTGCTPVDLLRRARLVRGHTLLISTGLSVSEIAYRVGFSSPSYFSKCYKDEYGTVPGDHRKT